MVEDGGITVLELAEMFPDEDDGRGVVRAYCGDARGCCGELRRRADPYRRHAIGNDRDPAAVGATYDVSATRRSGWSASAIRATWLQNLTND